MLTKGMMEFVAYIMGRMDAMEFDHQVVCQREQAFLLQHTNLHDTKKANHHKRNLEFLKLIKHPFSDDTVAKDNVATGIDEAIKIINGG